MPLVDNEYKQLFRAVKGEGKDKKPIFYSIGMPKANEENKYLYERKYFTIE